MKALRDTYGPIVTPTELENYGTTKKAYDKLKEIDPDLAMQFAYLELRAEDVARAAEISRIKEVVVWEE